jgi:ATP-dependent Clp protease ATP-binding subunit ClpB
VLLQILDDGRVTDSQGRTVDFKNTVIILTSNIGSQHLLEGITERGEILEGARGRVMGDLQGRFRPEFLNRIDEIVLFKPLTLAEITRIVDLQIADVAKRLRDRNISLEITAEAKEYVAKAGYDPVYGARPLKRYIQRQLETRIGRALLANEIAEGSGIKVELKDGELAVVPVPVPTMAAA